MIVLYTSHSLFENAFLYVIITYLIYQHLRWTCREDSRYFLYLLIENAILYESGAYIYTFHGHAVWQVHS